MPKMKTKSSAKKRFKVTASGKVKYKHSFGRHILTSKNSKRKRRLSQIHVASAASTPELLRMLRGG